MVVIQMVAIAVAVSEGVDLAVSVAGVAAEEAGAEDFKRRDKR
jgi:hypothetical protein